MMQMVPIVSKTVENFNLSSLLYADMCLLYVFSTSRMMVYFFPHCLVDDIASWEMSVSHLWPPKGMPGCGLLQGGLGLGIVPGTTGDLDHACFYPPHALLQWLGLMASAFQKLCRQHARQLLSITCNTH